MRHRLRESVDWKFWLSLTLAICVAYLSFVGYSAVQDGREKDRQINALIRTAEAKDEAAARRDAAAAADRSAAAENQAALLAYTRALAARQREVIAYLRANGIELPARFVSEIPAPSVAAEGPAQRKTRGRADRPPTTRRDLPGKSENAPGRNKHRPTPRGRR